MSRSSLLAALAAFVVGIGVVAWLGPGGGLHAVTSASPTPSPAPATPSPRPLVACVLTFSGTLNDCAIPLSRTGACSASGNTLQAVVHLQGDRRDYLLYIALVGSYHGPTTYPLWPWGKTDLSVPDVPKVAIREYDTGAIWDSSDGSITIGADGRSGTVNARLGYIGGLPTAPLGVLTLSGGWACV